MKTRRAPTEIDLAFGAAVRRHRLAIGTTIEQVAERCGVSYQQAQKYETGANRMSIGRAVQIAEALGTSVADLLRDCAPCAEAGVQQETKRSPLLDVNSSLDAAIGAALGAQEDFTEYFVRNYPGPDTIIHDPRWHAPKIFRAALAAIRAQARQGVGQ